MSNVVRRTVVNEAPVIGFEHPDHWQRFLTINGARAYNIGGMCDTCSFIFERIDYPERISSKVVGDRLASGVDLLDSTLLSAIDHLLPSGDYSVVELFVRPAFTRPCLENDYFCHESVDAFGTDAYSGVPSNPRTPYYRAGSGSLPPGSGDYGRLGKPQQRPADTPQQFFHFIVPMQPPNTLDRERVDHFRRQLEAGPAPAALGISVLDVRAPATAPYDKKEDPLFVYTEHWCLATYLLDGHHKIHAAAESGRAVRLLTFLAGDESIASKEDIEAALRFLGSDPAALQ